MGYGCTHMAKSDRTELEKIQDSMQRAIARANEAAAERDQALTEKQRTELALQAAHSELTDTQKKLERVAGQVEDQKPNRLKMAGVDFFGDLSAQGLNEGFNALVRWWADNNKGGLVAMNSDLLQSMPAFVGGAIWYGLEMWKVKREVPKGWKSMRLHAANLLMNLGFANLARTWRSRHFESKENMLQMQAALNETVAKNAQLQRTVADLQREFEQSRAQIKAGGRS